MDSVRRRRRVPVRKVPGGTRTCPRPGAGIDGHLEGEGVEGEAVPRAPWSRTSKSPARAVGRRWEEQSEGEQARERDGRERGERAPRGEGGSGEGHVGRVLGEGWGRRASRVCLGNCWRAGMPDRVAETPAVQDPVVSFSGAIGTFADFGGDQRPMDGRGRVRGAGMVGRGLEFGKEAGGGEGGRSGESGQHHPEMALWGGAGRRRCRRNSTGGAGRRGRHAGRPRTRRPRRERPFRIRPARDASAFLTPSGPARRCCRRGRRRGRQARRTGRAGVDRRSSFAAVGLQAHHPGEHELRRERGAGRSNRDQRDLVLFDQPMPFLLGIAPARPLRSQHDVERLGAGAVLVVSASIRRRRRRGGGDGRGRARGNAARV